MPITLITGPANAGKARAVMDAVRMHVAHGVQPLLVVPTRADAERYRRELAEAGIVGGARVERFAGLIGELVRRAGPSVPVLSELGREQVLAAILARGEPGEPGEPVGAGGAAAGGVAGAGRPPIGRSRSTPGYVRALAAVVAELQAQRVTPARLGEALRLWAAADGARATVDAEELSGVFAEYQSVLRRIGRTDAEQRAIRALDALRRKPALWGGTPVLLYGFDDFGRLQIDVIETLGVVADAPVTVSLTYEPGRVAFAGRASTFQTLAPLAAERIELQARAEYYAPRARAALHHLERSLFEPDAARVGRVDPGDAVRLLEGGGERAELELVAGEVRALLDAGGMRPEEIALVHRAPGVVADLVEEVFGALGIPYALERRVGFAHTAIGRALVGALRCVGGEGELGELLAWLRAPGLLQHPELADRLEARARRAGVTRATRAIALWEEEHWPLQPLGQLRAAAQRGGAALVERATRELERLFAAPRRGEAAVLERDELDGARALIAGRRVLGELGELARTDPRLVLDAAELARALEGVELVSGERAGPGRVAVVDPLALRARRVRALFLCGLQEGVFPASARSEPLLAEEQRRRLAETSGLRLGWREDALAAERYALYAAVSRPQELVVLSWHAASDDGAPSSRSLFVDDVEDLFEESLGERRARRPLGAVGWVGAGAPTRGLTPAPAPRDCAPTRGDSRPTRGGSTSTFGDPAPGAHLPGAPAPLRDEELLTELRGHVWSASSLEAWASCPVKWFVERMLRAGDLDPDPEPFARGGLAHAALKSTLEGLRERSGSARLTPARLGLARELMGAALREHEAEFPLSAAVERRPGLRRRLEADLERYLEYAAERESPLEPTYLELGFGFGEEEAQDYSRALPALPAPPVLPALDLGAGLRLRGRIDRVDVDAGGGRAVVYDYKGRDAPPAAKWVEEANVQVALYMRVVEELLGLEAVGGFYQPLSGSDPRARGVLDGDSGVELECVRGELREHAQVRDLLAAVVAVARVAAAQAGRGELEPRPRTCAYRGGCMYPTICRCEA